MVPEADGWVISSLWVNSVADKEKRSSLKPAET